MGYDGLALFRVAAFFMERAAIFIIERVKDEFMAKKMLSVFIDESDDFESFDFHVPIYLVAMGLHN